MQTYKAVGAMVEVTDLDPAISITVPHRANGVMLQATGASVRYTLDGSTPDADTGFKLVSGNDPTILPLRAGQVIKLFEETSSSILDYQFVRLDNR